MLIHFERTGGFMGRKVSLSLNLNELPEEQASTLRTLVEEANFLSIDDTRPTADPARDQFTYTVTIETDKIHHTIHTTDTSMPASLRPLIENLSGLARTGGR
ncbi:MAG TPA: hypothetical protein PLE14_03665 [Anaerolineales bacterium]|nr:hypothetical protein [Anaerolineales bacterium]